MDGDGWQARVLCPHITFYTRSELPGIERNYSTCEHCGPVVWDSHPMCHTWA